MNISYNVRAPEPRKKHPKSDEVLAIDNFLVGAMKNMCFEYDTGEDAKKGRGRAAAYRLRAGHQELYNVYRVDRKVYVVRMGVK